MAKYVLLDTGFWFAFYDQRDAYHGDAVLIVDDLSVHNMIVPWPCLYETLNTRFVRRPEWLASFRALMRQDNVSRLGDETYRERALLSALEPAKTGTHLSLVDQVIRQMLEDASVRVDAMVTFNEADFADLCIRRGIDMLP